MNAAAATTCTSQARRACAWRSHDHSGCACPLKTPAQMRAFFAPPLCADGAPPVKIEIDAGACGRILAPRTPAPIRRFALDETD